MKVIYITNIPTPYRNLLYNKMNSVFSKKNIDFEVWYMAETESDRSWKFEDSDFQYNYKIFNGFTLKIKNVHLHFNFSMYWKLLMNKYSSIIVGGYSSPSHVLSAFLGRAKNKILWSETNYIPTKKHKKSLTILKKIFLKPFNYFLIPGIKSKQYIQWLNNDLKDTQFLKLPNLIDEVTFLDDIEEIRKDQDRIKKIREKYNVDEVTPLWFCPARLEYFKGLDIFLPHLKGLKNYKLVVAGEGSQLELLEGIIKDNQLNVELVGQKNMAEVQELYAASDFFILPSVRDSSPLSAIEAIAGSLPVLISINVGNIGDVLVEDQNGWKIEPVTSASNVNLLKEITKLTREDLKIKGQLSRKLYKDNFDTDKWVNQHAQDLIDIN